MGRVLDDGDDSLEFFGGEFTGTVEYQSIVLLMLLKPFIPLIEIDVCLLAD